MGADKQAAAIAFAQGLLCASPAPDGGACGACETCRLVVGPGHPDVRVWDVPEGEKTFKVEQVRELVAAVGRKPYSAPRQVHIVAALDQMAAAGHNALLKTLEEPPPTSTLVLLANDAEGVLPTIRSRCQVIRFAAGESEAYTEAPPPLPRREEAMAWADEMAAKGSKARTADEVQAALASLLAWLHDIALVAAAQEGGAPVSVTHLLYSGHLKQAQTLAAQAPLRAWLAACEAVAEAQAALDRHANTRLVLDRLARRLAV